MRVQVAPCERYRLRVTTWGPFPIGGPSPRGSGAAPHAVVLPGISADWRGLAPQIRALRGLGWTVHVVDLPGFALPPALKASDANVVQLADYVARVVTNLKIPPALLLGHSLGGGVAMHLAMRHPKLVRGLALIAPVGLGVSLHWIYKLSCDRACCARRRSGASSSAAVDGTMSGSSHGSCVIARARVRAHSRRARSSGPISRGAGARREHSCRAASSLGSGSTVH